MSSRYETGKKSKVIRMACSLAIRYEESFIEALTPSFQEPNEETKEAIEKAKMNIRDFRKLLKSQCD